MTDDFQGPGNGGTNGKRVVTQYRNVDDFLFGSWSVRTGHGRLEIAGRLKDTWEWARFMVIEWRA
jgi:hypothetical protein